MKHFGVHTKKGMRRVARDGGLALVILACTTFFLVLLAPVGVEDLLAPMLFVLAVFLISYSTSSYWYGIAASIVSVGLVNYIFTYPYMAFNFSFSGYPIIFAGMLVISIATSALTTKIKRQELSRAEMEKERMRANFLRAISHDLRTPLTSIIGATSAVLEHTDTLDAQTQKELLTGVIDNAQWMIRMVENLLSVTRVSGGTKIAKIPEAAEEVIGEVIRKFKQREPNIDCIVTVPDHLLLVPMDFVMIEQVLINFLDNAVVHGRTTTKVHISVRHVGDTAVFQVADNGVGIDRDKLSKLFESDFNYSDSTDAQNLKNMGIGLSVCKAIINAHGGDIAAQNNRYGGAIFQFTLPLGKEQPQDGDGN